MQELNKLQDEIDKAYSLLNKNNYNKLRFVAPKLMDLWKETVEKLQDEKLKQEMKLHAVDLLTRLKENRIY
jgi:hypothetical protein